MSTPHSPADTRRLLPDSPDARVFIELASCIADLTAAADTLDLAVRGRHEGGFISAAQSALTDYAAVAYCRADDKHKGAVRMSELIEIPVERRPLHDLVHAYRSRFVAHSQSDLSSTFAFVALDEQGRPRAKLSTYTVHQPMPRTIIDQFRVLIADLLGVLSERQLLIASDIRRKLLQVDASVAASWPQRPAISHAVIDDYDPRSLRARYPTTITLFWDQDA
ncbi:MAG: hypothetical protein Q8M65_10830 [Rhodoglobus sp.]|nr:hypothetical protein [Rhodoglobus sp.]